MANLYRRHWYRCLHIYHQSRKPQQSHDVAFSIFSTSLITTSVLPSEPFQLLCSLSIFYIAYTLLSHVSYVYFFLLDILSFSACFHSIVGFCIEDFLNCGSIFNVNDDVVSFHLLLRMMLSETCLIISFSSQSFSFRLIIFCIFFILLFDLLPLPIAYSWPWNGVTLST